MKRSLLAALILASLTGCSGFSFRPFASVICTSACRFDLLAPQAAQPASSASK